MSAWRLRSGDKQEIGVQLLSQMGSHFERRPPAEAYATARSARRSRGAEIRLARAFKRFLSNETITGLRIWASFSMSRHRHVQPSQRGCHTSRLEWFVENVQQRVGRDSVAEDLAGVARRQHDRKIIPAPL